MQMCPSIFMYLLQPEGRFWIYATSIGLYCNRELVIAKYEASSRLCRYPLSGPRTPEHVRIGLHWRIRFVAMPRSWFYH